MIIDRSNKTVYRILQTIKKLLKGNLCLLNFVVFINQVFLKRLPKKFVELCQPTAENAELDNRRVQNTDSNISQIKYDEEKTNKCILFVLHFVYVQ